MPERNASTGRDGQGRPGDSVLVVGLGFIGSHVASELTSRGRRFTVLTRTPPPREVADAIGPEELRIGDAADLPTIAGSLDGVSEVVYCAGGKLPAQTEEDPELSTELTLEPINALLTCLRDRPGVGLTYVSSGGTVYGEPASVPVPEDAPTAPRAIYGRLHLACEAAIERARETAGLDARILRCSTLYGEHQRPDRGQGAVVTFLDRIAREEEIVIYGDGGAVRDYLYAGDVSRTIADLLDREDVPGVLNVGSGDGVSLRDLVEVIEREVGRRARVVTRPERDFEVHKIVLDISRLRDLLDFEPLPLADGVARTHAWLASTTGQTA
ncbi:MAG TPA: NAD-dependent epimerase/dehydratase family protein [Solirubrobacterales bacterium]